MSHFVLGFRLYVKQFMQLMFTTKWGRLFNLQRAGSPLIEFAPLPKQRRLPIGAQLTKLPHKINN